MQFQLEMHRREHDDTENRIFYDIQEMLIFGH